MHIRDFTTKSLYLPLCSKVVVIKIQQQLAKLNPELSEFFNQYQNDATAKKDELSALIYAIKNKKTDIAKLLIESGVNIDKEHKHGRTALEFALITSNTELVRLLLNMGATADMNVSTRFNSSYLSLAAERNDANKKAFTNSYLIHAIQGKNRELAQSIIDHDVDMPIQHPELAKLLIEKGADIHAKLDYESTLTLAISYNQPEVAKILIDKGADVNKSKYYEPLYPEGAGLLFYAILKDYHAMSRLLVNSGYELKKLNVMGHTPLIQALSSGSYNLVQLLIKKGADVNMKTASGKCPLSVLSYTKEASELRNLLKKHGAKCIK